jgi:hypothetical protein
MPDISLPSRPMILSAQKADTCVKNITESIASGVNASKQVAQPNTLRKGLIIWNNSSNSVYLSYESVANSASCTFILATFQSWVMPNPIYTGIISAIRNSGTGTLTVWELT